MWRRTNRHYSVILPFKFKRESATRSQGHPVDPCFLALFWLCGAAWGIFSVSCEAAMAKLYATESAQQVIDKALQMFGGKGVESGNIIESLYREIRALRIYEGASEVQKLIIGRQLLG